MHQLFFLQTNLNKVGELIRRKVFITSTKIQSPVLAYQLRCTDSTNSFLFRHGSLSAIGPSKSFWRYQGFAESWWINVTTERPTLVIDSTVERFVRIHLVQPYCNTDTATPWKISLFILTDQFHIFDTAEIYELRFFKFMKIVLIVMNHFCE